jgi:hypothetical protein
MAATKGSHFDFQSCSFPHIFIGETWLATHCHFPLGIFTQVSVQRTCSSNGFPDASVPFHEDSRFKELAASARQHVQQAP